MKKILITILCTSVLTSCAIGWRVPPNNDKEWNDSYDSDAWREHFRECAAFLESETAWHWCMNQIMEDEQLRITKSPIEDTTIPKSNEDDICWWADSNNELRPCPNISTTTTTTSTITTNDGTILGIVSMNSTNGT